MMDRSPDYTDGYNDGLREGYKAGEMERIALATANSELRSDLLALRLQIALERA